MKEWTFGNFPVGAYLLGIFIGTVISLFVLNTDLAGTLGYALGNLAAIIFIYVWNNNG